MLFVRPLFAVAVALLLVPVFSATAKADTYHHVDGLALTIERQATELLGEFQIHYRHTRQFAHLQSDAIEMQRLASHVHELAHHRGSLSHLDADVHELSDLHHHIQSLVAEIETTSRFGRRGGHIHGRTSHVQGLLTSMDANIHHLQDDIHELRRAQQFSSPRVNVGRPIQGAGFRIGNGGIWFSIGR